MPPAHQRKGNSGDALPRHERSPSQRDNIPSSSSTLPAGRFLLPMPLEDLRHHSSVQILHKIRLLKELDSSDISQTGSKRSSRQGNRSTTIKSHHYGTALSALLMSSGGEALHGVETLLKLVPSVQSSPDVTTTSAAPNESLTDGGRDLIPLPRRGRRETSPERRKPIGLEGDHVVEALYHKMVERRDILMSSPTQSMNSTMVGGEDHTSGGFHVESPTKRQRLLQQQAWKRIAYGDAQRAAAGSRSPPSSPKNEIPTSSTPQRQSSPNRPGSMGSFRGASASDIFSGSFANGSMVGVRQGSFAGSFRSSRQDVASPTGRHASFARSGSRGALINSLPSAEVLAEAFAAAKQHFMKVWLRKSTDVAPLMTLRDDDGTVRESLDVAYAKAKISISEELHHILFHAVIHCRIAQEVSHCDAPLNRMVRQLTPLLTLPPFIEATTGSTPNLELRGFGCHGLMRWVCTSFSQLPRSSVTVAVAADSCCVGFAEYPGTGRAGSAPTATVIFGSKLEMLEFEAVNAMLLHGMMGLEGVERAVIEFHGPQALDRAYEEFREGTARARLQVEHFRELYQTVAHQLRMIRHAARRHDLILRGEAGLRQTQKYESVHPTQYSIAFTTSVKHAMDTLIISQDEVRKHLWQRSIFRQWCDMARISLANATLTTSLFAMTFRTQLSQSGDAVSARQAAANDKRIKAAQNLFVQAQTRTLRGSFHAFYVSCMKMKCARHVRNIQHLEQRLQASGRGRKEVVVADAALRYAKQLVTQITSLVRAQGGYVHPITLTGHSTGGAIAVLAACLINAESDASLSVRRVVTFGAPKVFRANCTDVLQSLGVLHLAITHGKDPAVHQPWTFDHSGIGAFVIGGTNGHDADDAGPSDESVGGDKSTTSEVVPTPWTELPPTPCAAMAHWYAFHSVESYLKRLAPQALPSHASPKRPSPLGSAQENLLFESQVLAPSPVRGASHGFSVAAMRCLQHIATRYGVGTMQKIPRDFLLSVLGMMEDSATASLHMHAERVPFGQGGRMDQSTFVSWAWAELMQNPRFLSRFFKLLHYEFNGRDFFPTQKALVTLSPIPKIHPVAMFWQVDQQMNLTAVGRAAVDHLFRLYSRPFTLGVFEFRLTQGTPLISRHCIAQLLENGGWTFRLRASTAVTAVYQQVAQEHLQSKNRRQSTVVYERLSMPKATASDAASGDGNADENAQILMSFSGDLTARGFQVFMQTFVRVYGVMPLLQALSALGFGRQWTPTVTKSVDINNDIHWKYGVCPCLDDDAERRRIHASEDAKFKSYVSRLAADMAQRRRSSRSPESRASVTQPTVDIGVATTVTSDAFSGNFPSEGNRRQRSSLWWAGSDVVAATPMSFVSSSPTVSPAVSPKAAEDPDDYHDFYLEAIRGDVTSPMDSRAMSPSQRQHEPPRSAPLEREMFNTTMYSTKAEDSLRQWTASGNGKRLQRENLKLLKQFVVEDMRSATSIGSKPKHRVPKHRRAEERTHLSLQPATNSLSRVGAMYSSENTLRILNPSQRHVLKLPPLRNELLEGPANDDQRDPVLPHGETTPLERR